MELKNICKAYGGNAVLKDVSLVIPKGSRTVITAPSGGGKTTLLHIMMGLEEPDSGEVIGRPAKQAAVFQEDRFPDEFTPVNCVKMTSAHGISRQTVLEHLEQVGLKGHTDKPVMQISGGMRRRVAIVRAVLGESEIIYFDEPFTGLDNDTKMLVIDYIDRHTKGKTLVFVSHSPDDEKLLNAKKLRIV